MNKNLQIRRGLHENIPVLLEGEPGFSTDTKSLYIGTGEENVHIVNETDLDNKVHFKNKPAKQFNFASNELVQDGLIGSFKNNKQSKVYKTTSNKLTLVVKGFYDITDRKSGAFVLAKARGFLVGIDSSGIWYAMGAGIEYSDIGLIYAKSGNFLIKIILDNLEVKIEVHANNTKINKTFKIKNFENNSCSFFEMYSGDLIKNSYCNGFVYEKILTSQEIDYNLSVLNNTDSIKSLEVIRDDTTTSYNFATTENHVEMSTGRTLHDEYMGVLKTMGKEFESADGSDITVENGLEARVISGEISGRTVKSVLGNVFAVGGGITKIDDEWYKCVNTDRYYIDAICLKRLPSVLNTSYSFFIEFRNCNITCKVNTLIGIGYSNTNGVFIEEVVPVKGNVTDTIKNGIIKITFTPNKESKNGFSIRLFRGDKPSTSENSCEFRLLGAIENEEVEIINPVDIGLNSTQAIITNNGQEYKFFKPTVQGKTKVFKATKGTQQWVEISNDETRDLDAYDYKLQDLNNELSSLMNKRDVLDLKTNIVDICVGKTKINWLYKLDEGDNYSRFTFEIEDKQEIYNNNDIICDKLKFTKNATEVNCIVENKGNLLVVLPKKYNTPDLAMKYIGECNIYYELATPKQKKLSDKLIEQYKTYKNTVLLYNNLDQFKINNDGSGFYIQKFKKVFVRVNDYNVAPYNHEYIKEGMIGFNLTTDFTDIYYETRKIKDIGYCDLFGLHSLEYILAMENESGITVYSNGGIYGVLPKSILETPDIEGIKKLLKDKILTIIYPLANPITTEIPKELMPPVSTHVNNKFSVGGIVKSTGFKLTLPTTDNSKKDFVLSLVNNWSGNAKAILTREHKGKLICTLTAPESFNTLVTNLPTELRPKTEKVVLGIKDTTPVAIKIAPDGTVKIPETITGTIQIDAAYEL